MRKKCQMEALGQVYKNCHTIFFNLPNGPYNSFRQNYQSKTMYLHSTFNTLHWNACQFCVDLSIGYNCTLNNEVYLFQKIFFDSSRTEIRSFGSKNLNKLKICDILCFVIFRASYFLSVAAVFHGFLFVVRNQVD